MILHFGQCKVCKLVVEKRFLLKDGKDGRRPSDEEIDKMDLDFGICEKCGGQMTSVFEVSNRQVVNIGYKDNPRWSWSMGVNVEDIPKMMKQYPDRTYHPETGQLLVKNRPEKRKLAKQHGMEEYN